MLTESSRTKQEEQKKKKIIISFDLILFDNWASVWSCYLLFISRGRGVPEATPLPREGARVNL